MLNLEEIASITQVESGETLQSQEFCQKILKRAEELKQQYGIGAGVSVLILQNNSIQFFINLLAVLHLGATAIPMDPASSKLEIETIRSHSQVSLILSQQGEDFTGLKHLDSYLNMALVLYTSGTTGAPKGVLISRESLKNKLTLLHEEIGPEDCIHSLCALPTFFGHGLICNSLFPLFYGKAFFIAKKFDLSLVSRLPEIIEEHQISFFSSVPSVWELVLNFSEEKFKTNSLRRVHCASSPLSEVRAKQINEWLPSNVNFYNVYGITEMLGWFASVLIDRDSANYVFKNFWRTQYKIIENQELSLKSAFMFSGYLNNDEAYRNAMTSDGFFKTGDIFKDGELKGRLSLVINKKGFKIYPQEIDSFLMSSDLVSDTFTFGISDQFSNELIAVLICLRDNATIDDIRSICMKNLSSYKIPDRFIEVQKIERNARGKVSAEYINNFKKRFRK